MKYKILISSRATDDITSALNYIGNTLLNPQAADDLQTKIEHDIRSLASMPKRYPLIDDPLLASWGLRFMMINNYIAFFTVDDDNKTVNIIRFMYGKRNWRRLLE